MNKHVARGICVTFVGRIERALVIADGFQRPCRRVRFVEFLVVLIFDDVAEFIASDCPIGHLNQEF